jgi:O-antigen/teichoic acid export membrane protein
MLAAICLIFLDDFVILLLKTPEMQTYLWLMPVAIFFGGTFLVLRYWFARFKKFGAISKAQIFSSGIVQADKLGMGYAGHATGGSLIIANLMGQIASVAILGAPLIRSNWQLFRTCIGWDKLLSNIKAHKNFPLYSTWSVLLNTASLYMPAIMLGFYFSTEVVGFYALGRAMLGIPLTLLGGSIGQVFFQKASQVRDQKGELSRVVEAVYKRLMVFGMLPIFMLMFVGEDIFVVAFGRHWAEAGSYVQILALLVFFQFISSPISMLFSVLEQQRQGLYFNLLLFTTRITALILGGMSGDVRLTIFLLAYTGAACYSILFFWLISKAGVPFGGTCYHFLRQAIYIAPVLVLIISIKWYGGYGEMSVLIWSGCSVMLYYLLAVRHDKELREAALTILKKR